ncbi:hypothetical protein GGR28_001868 [Lewinella aquimaris]|uniref:FAS1 domain-containing protein n=1 Tax=Neolewinella aquimaris TaxID=1835722 RepID=A0A840EB62_9BACT|nr:hypothetical protein [Neolewinella aquimaris]MBB4079248.1 hypothetical protein [Neolewinella aquimaris]
MTTINYTNGSGFLLLCAIFFLSGCDLQRQERFKFEPDIAPQVTFDMTALDFIRLDPGDEFNYLDTAITLTGLEAEYSTNADMRTYLLLKDRAFTDGGEILQQISGSTSTSMDSLDDTQIERLRYVLRYHIIEAYIENGFDPLEVLYQDYFFQTLIPGDDGIISINRDDRFRLSVNRSDDLQGTKKGGRINEHNYIFTNGVAHLVTDSYRNARY